MAMYYEVYGKIATTENVEAIYRKCKTKAEAFAYMMKEMGNYCQVGPELAWIVRSGAPAPCYRRSVYQYLKKFFHQGKQGNGESIDYSDFTGQIRPFPPEQSAQDQEFASGYEQRMGITEYFGYSRSEITDYDRKLGFIFSVSPVGMHVQFLNSKVCSSCMLQLCGEEYVFSYESGRMGSASVDIRAVKREGTMPARIESTAYPVLLLDILLNETEKKPIVTKVAEDNDPNACLLWRLNHELYEKMNSAQCSALSDIEVSGDRVQGYLDAIEKVGYGLVTETKKWCKIDYSGKQPIPINIVERAYYIPPLICQEDADCIIESIRESGLSDKNVLVDKFRRDSGYHRYAKDPQEEAQITLPQKDERRWTPSYYSLMIWKMLRMMDRAVPVTSGTGENLQGLLEQSYGKEINHRTITEHLSSMMAAGLPVKKEKQCYRLNREQMLSEGDLDAIVACVTQDSKLDNAAKERLLQKLKEKFPRLPK